MFTVYVAAEREAAVSLEGQIAGIQGAVLLGRAQSLRQALSDCAEDMPTVLLLDDRLLTASLGLMPQLETVPYAVVLLSWGHDPQTTRRALQIRARDLLQLPASDQDITMALSRFQGGLDTEKTVLGRVLTIFSSKGGVGKTTLAVNLAVALGMLTKKPVALVDLDLQFGDVAALLGEMPRSTIHDLAESVSVDALSLGRVMQDAAGGRVRLLAAPLEPQEAEDIRAELVVQVLQILRDTHAYVIIDTTPGFNDVNVSALDYADHILTIITPDVVTIRSIKQALDLFWKGFQYPVEKVRLIMNRGGSRTGIDAGDIGPVLNQKPYWELPSDGIWPVRAANQGRPLVTYQPDSLLSQSIKDLARALVEETEGPKRAVKKRTGGRGGWLDRIGVGRR